MAIAQAKTITKIYLLAVVLCTVGGIQPASAAGLLEVYRQAVASDPVLAEAAAQRQANQEAKPQARALWLPRLDGSAALDYNFDVDPRQPGQDSDFDSNSISIQLSQALYNRANLARLRQADSILEQADANFETAADSLLLRVADAYFEILGARDDLTFTLKDKEATARQLEQARQRFEVGLITITDVQEAQARFDQVSANEIVARNNLDDRREELRRLTGELYQNLQTLSPRLPLELPEPANPDAWVDLAIKNNPALESAQFAVDIARETVEVQRSGHYPRLDLVAGYSDSRSDNVDSNGGQIGLRLEVPIFEGFAVGSRTREAAFQLEATKELREQQLRAITTQVRNAYRGVAASISEVQALDQARVSSRSALEATEAGFEVGTRTIVDVLNAQRNLFQADRDYARARYVYVLNMLSLKQAAGTISEEDLEQIGRWLVASEN